MITIHANGNLTRDPELRTTQSGKQVVSFSIASNRGKDETDFLNCTAWEKIAELINEYCKKGDRLYVTGDFKTDRYEKDGIQKTSVSCVVRSFDFPPKGGSENPVEVNAKPATIDELEDEIPF